MKYRILPAFCALFLILSANAQKNPGHAYAVTSEKQGSFAWTEVKLIDLSTGDVLQNVYENAKASYNVFEARSGKQIKVRDDKGIITDNRKLPFSGLSAACAYDKKLNRLYYAPMFINQLRYIDLNAKTPQIYFFEGETLSSAEDMNNEANHITRMVIAADGNGYALNNDGTHLIRFSTGKKPVITDLGSLQDDPKNDSNSIFDKNLSWGGDMISDAKSNLYVISARNAIFKIDIEKKTATYINKINGLPENYTSNGAVVDNNGKIVVSSANSTKGYYVVDPASWKATLLENKGVVYNASDLANENFLFQNEARDEPLIKREIIVSNKISLYPNPVSTGLFRVTFNTIEKGRYNIQLIDLSGKMISNKLVNVTNTGDVAGFEVSKKIAKGMYLVKVLNNNNKEVFSDRIVVE